MTCTTTFSRRSSQGCRRGRRCWCRCRRRGMRALRSTVVSHTVVNESVSAVRPVRHVIDATGVIDAMLSMRHIADNTRRRRRPPTWLPVRQVPPAKCGTYWLQRYVDNQPDTLVRRRSASAGCQWHLRLCVSVCLCVHALKGKRVDLSTPNLVHIYSVAGTRHALTIISGFFIVTLLRLCGLRNSSAILATLKKFD